jgi:hypothetical protein
MAEKDKIQQVEGFVVKDLSCLAFVYGLQEKHGLL